LPGLRPSGSSATALLHLLLQLPPALGRMQKRSSRQITVGSTVST
jgi:hypothetical protein